MENKNEHFKNEYFNKLFYSPDEYLQEARPDLLEDSETHYLANQLKLAREALLAKLEGKL